MKLHVSASSFDSVKKGVTCALLTLLRVHVLIRTTAVALHAETLQLNPENHTTVAAVHAGPVALRTHHQKSAPHGEQCHHGTGAQRSSGQLIAWQDGATAAQDLLSSAVRAVSAEAERCSPEQVQTQCDADAVAGQHQSSERFCAGLELEWGTAGVPRVCEQAGGLHWSQHGIESASA